MWNTFKPKKRLLLRSEPYSHRLRSSTRSSDMAAASQTPVADQVPETPDVHRQLQPAVPASPPLLRPQPIRPPLRQYHVTSAVARTPAVSAAAQPSFAGLPTTPEPFCDSPVGVRQLIVGAASTSGVGGRVDGTSPRRCSAFCPYSRGAGNNDVTSPPLATSGSEVGVYSDEAAAVPLDLSCRGREVGRWTEACSPYRNHGVTPPTPPRPATVHRERFGTQTTTPCGRDGVHRRDSVHGPRSLSAGHVPLPDTSDAPLPGRSMPVAVNSGGQLALPFRDDCNYCTGDLQLPANGEHCTYDMSLSYGWARHVLGLPQSPLFGPRRFSVTCSNCSHTMFLRLL